MKNKKLICGILSAAMIFTSLPAGSLPAFAETETVQSTELTTSESSASGEGSYLLTYRDDGFVAEASTSASSTTPYKNNKSTALASKFITDSSKLTALRNQNPYGTCWAFGSIAMAEMSILAQENKTMDLSELHLAYYMYNNTATDPLGGTQGDANHIGSQSGKGNCLEVGGSYFYSAKALASWQGAASESTFSYDLASQVDAGNIPSVLTNSNCYNDVAHLRSAYYINIKENPEIVKQMIMKYGAVGISYYATDGYNETNNCYYQDEYTSTNHAVTVVGWDDNFSKDKFTETPSGNGAWLVRNSWYYSGLTNEYCLYGYFWLSYYDTSIDDTAYAFDFVSEDSAEFYDNNYQYDGAAFSGYIYGCGSVSAANVFTCQNDCEELKAVQFETATTDASYKARVYLNPQSDNPESGRLYAEQTGSITTGGIYNVKLGDGLTLHKGDTYSVVITITAKNSTEWISLTTESNNEDESNWIVSTASMEEGQSYQKVNGSWVDLYDSYRESYEENAENHEAKANIRIKALTDNVNEEGTTVTSLSVKSNPTTLPTKCTDVFNPAGMVITAKYSDGTTKDLTLSYSNSAKSSILAKDTAGNVVSGVIITPSLLNGKSVATTTAVDIFYMGKSAEISFGTISHNYSSVQADQNHQTYVETCSCGASRSGNCIDQTVKISLSASSLVLGRKGKISVTTNAPGAKITYYLGNAGTPIKIDANGNITTLSAGYAYIYVMIEGSGKYKSYVSSAYLLTITPSAVTGLTATSAAKGITLKWTKNSSADGYIIYRSINGGSYYAVKYIQSASTVTYTDSWAVNNGKKYSYKVCAYNSYSGASPAAAVVTSYFLTKPTIKSLKNSASKAMTVSWNRNSSASGYQIQYSTSSKFASAKTITVSSNKTTSKAIKKLTKKKTYYVRVRSYKTVGKTKYYSAWSSAKSVKIKK